MSHTLHGVFGNFRTTIVAIAFEVAEIEYTGAWKTWQEIKSDDFKKINPLQQVPAIETSEGCIAQTNAILRYIARTSKKSLYGESEFQKAQVDQWLDYFNSEILSNISAMGAFVGFAPFDGQKCETSLKALVKQCKFLDSHLSKQSFLVGNHVTIADIPFCSFFKGYFSMMCGEGERKRYPNLVSWFETVQSESHQAFSKWHGKKQRFCSTPWTPLGMKQQEVRLGGEKKEKQEKKDKPKQEKKEQQKKKEAPAKKPKDDDEEEEEKPKEKAKNPLDLLPESKFNFFDFKTLITNSDKKESCKFLWDNYDPAGFSIWKVQYDELEGETEKLHITNNLRSGFLERLEHFRKYTYSVHGVYGDEPKLKIRGLWMWKGTEIPFEIKDHPQGDYQIYTKLDHTKEEDRKMLENYWCNTTEGDMVDGLKCQNVKFFK